MADILLQLLLRLLPVAISIGLLLVGNTYGAEGAFSVSFTSIAVAAILGFSASIWIEGHKTSRTLKRLNIKTTHGFEIIKTREDRKAEAIRMYSIRNPTRIVATHIGEDSFPAPKDDIAYSVYAKGNCNTNFERIVSIGRDQELNWVKSTLSKKKNPNFHVRRLEIEIDEALFPNFILVETSSFKKVFVSFRATKNEGGFAFATTDPEITQGFSEYADFLIDELDKFAL